MGEEMEKVRQLTTELDSIVGGVTNLKTTSQDIQGIAERIDGGNQQAIREIIKELSQAQQTIHTVVSFLTPVRELILYERVKLEQVLDSKKAVPS